MSTSPEHDSRQVFARVIPLTDFGQVGELFANWRGRLEQISGGRFEGTLRLVIGEHIRMIGVTANQRVLLRGYDASGMFSVFPVTNGNSGSLWSGRRLYPGHLVVDGADAETDHYSARQVNYQGACFRRTDLVKAAKSLLATEDVALPKNWTAISLPSNRFARINLQLSMMLSQGIADPSLLGTAEGARLEQECVRAIVDAIFSPVSQQSDLPLPARSHIFRKAEEYMRSHLGEPVGAIDICRELGVSDRTLRLAFRERVGIGPMAYFKNLRLNAVRSRLRVEPVTAIADVAGAFGFHHAGNFAADYRRLFRERPSETPRMFRTA